MQVEALVCLCWKKLYYSVLSIVNCQVYCFQSTLSKVTDMCVDKFDSERHYVQANEVKKGFRDATLIFLCEHIVNVSFFL